MGGAFLVLVLLVASSALMGWQWVKQIPCRTIEITETPHVPLDEALALARIDTGQALYAIDPVVVADRVQRHPWVETADVRRYPTGVLSIRIEERRPVALALDASGRPERFLDRHGHQMPYTAAVVHDVPLVHGLREPFRPTQPLRHESMRDLLDTLGRIDPAVDPLLSEFVVSSNGDVRLYTAVVEARGTVPVELGRRDFDEKFDRLAAFWHQAVLTQPDKAFASIDLRFNSQIVVREHPRPDAAPRPGG